MHVKGVFAILFLVGVGNCFTQGNDSGTLSVNGTNEFLNQVYPSTVTPTTERSIPTFFPQQLNVSSSGDPEIDRRRDTIVNITRSAWGAYARYAWGQEALKPVSNRSASFDDILNFGPNVGRTIVASL